MTFIALQIKYQIQDDFEIIYTLTQFSGAHIYYRYSGHHRGFVTHLGQVVRGDQGKAVDPDLVDGVHGL